MDHEAIDGDDFGSDDLKELHDRAQKEADRLKASGGDESNLRVSASKYILGVSSLAYDEEVQQGSVKLTNSGRWE